MLQSSSGVLGVHVEGKSSNEKILDKENGVIGKEKHCENSDILSLYILILIFFVSYYRSLDSLSLYPLLLRANSYSLGIFFFFFSHFLLQKQLSWFQYLLRFTASS